MKISSIKITGFKSFVDGVHLPIEAGLTGIVGPNGCGKSNILESLRWVMGASSAKALRGAEMDDVIFSGTDTRPARDIAEVIVTLHNDEKNAPEPFRNEETLEISRRIRRGIGSVFRINGKEVRAKDVQLLFADASSGANSPALVRQGQVSELINAKPENRRRVIEEAAGISGIQARRHEAQVKLAATQTNLERIGEILVIMEEHIASLQKEARRAQKYRGLAANIRGFESFILMHRYQSMQANLKAAEDDVIAANSKLGQCQIEINAKAKAVEAAEIKLPAAREEQAVADAVLRRLEAKSEDFERELKLARELMDLSTANISRINQDVLHENEGLSDAVRTIAENTQKLNELGNATSLEDEIEKAQLVADKAHELAQKIESELNLAIANHARLEAEQRAAIANQTEAENEVLRLESQLKDKTKSLDELSNAKPIGDFDALEAQIKALEQEIETSHKHSETANSNMAKAQENENIARNQSNEISNQYNKLKAQIDGLSQLIGKSIEKAKSPAIEHIKVKPGFEMAIAAALGDDLDAQIGDSGNNFWSGAQTQTAIWPKDFGAVQTLLDVVEAPKELHARLGAIAIVDESVFANCNHLNLGLRIVTPMGDLKRWDGLSKTRNAQTASAVRLEQKNHLEQLQQKLPLISEEMAIANEAVANANIQLKAAREAAETARSRAPNLMRDLAKLRSEFARIEGEKLRYDAKVLALSNEIETLKGNFANAQSKYEQIKQSASNDSKQAINTAFNIVNECNSQVQKARNEASRTLSLYMGLSREQEARENSINELKAQNENWQTRINRAQTRLLELEQELEKQSKTLEVAQSKPQEIENARILVLNELPIIQARKANADDNFATIEREIKDAQLALKDAEIAANSVKEAFNTASFLRDSWHERISELSQEVLSNFNFNIDELERRTEAALGDSFKDMNIEKAQNRLARALADRETLGGVNLRADEELKEQSERAEKLRTESQDLMAAIAKLNKGIDEINAEGRERLLAAFDVVNAHFSQLFTALFDGGEAHLALTETDDPLGGGLEVFACPPGKRLQTMSLMSGGEQALTATALIFAVFLSNPAPVSVLDELDAPLDDANVDRFCRLMDEMRKRTDTRFICITHHPITMARMDRLFGVTMAERGVSQIVAVDLSRAEAMIEG